MLLELCSKTSLLEHKKHSITFCDKSKKEKGMLRIKLSDRSSSLSVILHVSAFKYVSQLSSLCRFLARDFFSYSFYLNF